MRPLLICLGLFLSFMSYAQEKPVKVVFDVTSGDEAVHQTAIRHVKFMAEAYPQSEFEVVLYSNALDMVMPGKSVVEKEVRELVENENVKFVVCSGTMRRYEVTQDDLIPGVQTVPDGLMEIIAKQQEGWGYIKEAKN